mgnify:CR=1 FL=1
MQKEDDDEGDNMLGGATAEQMEVESDPAAAAAARQQHRAWQPMENERELMKFDTTITVELARYLLMVSHGSVNEAKLLYSEGGNRRVKYRAIAHAGRHMAVLQENFHLATAVYTEAEAANDGATFANQQAADDAMRTKVEELLRTGELAKMRATIEQVDDFDDDDDGFSSGEEDEDGNDDSNGQEDNGQSDFALEAEQPESKAAHRKRSRDDGVGVVLQPAAQRSRATATESAKTRSSASPARHADPLPAAAAAVAATGKRKREADAEVTEQARGVELEGSGIENEEKEKEKKRRRISAAEWKKMTRGQRKNYMRRHKR